MERVAEIGSDVKSKALLVAYWVHLALPLLLVLDSLAGLRLGSAGKSGLVVLIASSAWLVAGVTTIRFSRNRNRVLQRAANPLIFLFACCIGFGLMEIVARVAIGNRNVTVYDPGARLAFRPAPGLFPGIHGIARFSVNEVGLRGPSLPKKGDPYKIIAVGGSTTQCAYLDDEESWPSLLMKKLNRGQAKVFTWVANAGVSGFNSVDHLYFLQNIPILSEADLLVFLVGANDLGATLAFEGAPTQSYLEEHAAVVIDSLRHGGLGVSRKRFPIYKRMELYELLRKGKVLLAARMGYSGLTESDGKEVMAMHARRTAGPIVPLPSLETGLKEYRNRIQKIARECSTRRIRCLFLTQPSMLRGNLSEVDQKLLWLGWVGRNENPKGFLGVADYARAMEEYNRELLSVCREGSLECYDLDPTVPKDTSSFYDDLHFNEGGAQVVAEHLADYLLSTPPFRAGGDGMSMPDQSRSR